MSTLKLVTHQRAPQDDPAAVLIRLVGERVRAVRLAAGLSRRELSETSGVSPRYLAQLEGGEGNISIGLLQRVAGALERPVDSFLAAADPLAAEAAVVADLYRKADAATRASALRILDPERMRAQKAERICLVGLRGAGKSTLGAMLGADLGFPFVELNDEIEKSAGMPTREIIALYGQEGYRELEAAALAEVIEARERVVLAAAGGIVANPETFTRLLSRFHTVWIKASPFEHMERVRAQGDTRPMAGNPQAMVQLRAILKAREALYSETEHRLDTCGKSVEASRAALNALITDQGILEEI